MGERRSAYRVLVKKPYGKIPHGRSRRRWDDNIKTYLQDVEWGRNGLDGSELGKVAGCCEWTGWFRIGTGGGLL
jgi:hypothetical protein